MQNGLQASFTVVVGFVSLSIDYFFVFLYAITNVIFDFVSIFVCVWGKATAYPDLVPSNLAKFTSSDSLF